MTRRELAAIPDRRSESHPRPFQHRPTNRCFARWRPARAARGPGGPVAYPRRAAVSPALRHGVRAIFWCARDWLRPSGRRERWESATPG